ncbi:MAG TPA: hypothetical protein VMM54_05405, partial [Nitrospirota bacterium]|nr:hypothetical protein [Nitrospirota bacterium]
MPLDRDTYFLSEITKRREVLANSIQRPKIIFTGGSATFMGVRTKDIQSETGIPTINLSMHTKLGLDYILYEAK